MKFYKDINNEVFAYESDGSQDHLIGDKVLMTVEEVELHINSPKTPEQILAEQRVEIERQLSVLTVTSSKGNIFDADSQARQDMADAILASDTLGITKTVWRMADDSEVLIDIIELKEAHALAIQEYARIKGIGV